MDRSKNEEEEQQAMPAKEEEEEENKPPTMGDIAVTIAVGVIGLTLGIQALKLSGMAFRLGGNALMVGGALSSKLLKKALRPFNLGKFAPSRGLSMDEAKATDARMVAEADEDDMDDYDDL